MLTHSNFTCGRCGDCCRYLTVKLCKDDISVITSKGFGEDFFIVFDDFIKGDVLKKTDSGCVFLGSGKEEYYCKIYDVRPRVCRDYPFVESDKVESCKPDLLKFKTKT